MAISLNVSSPAAIPDLDALKSTVSAYLDRDDLDTLLPQFILLAEAMFNLELRCSEMETTTLLEVEGEDTVLPADYLAMRAVYEEGSPDRPLNGMAPSAIRQGFDGTAGTPTAYTLVAGFIRLVPPPSSVLLLRLDYWAQIANLSTTSPSNWLLEKHPDAYLYATLFQAEAYLDNAVRAGQWKQLTDLAVARINRSSRSDRYGAGPLVPNAVSQVRGAKC